MKLGKVRAYRFVRLFEDKIRKGEKILDLGAGSGQIAQILHDNGVKVTLVDIQDYNQTNLPLILYNGQKLPFKDNSFDWAILISVLHHCENPTLVLREAKRVSQKIILIEDIYSNWWNKLFLEFNDWLFNLPFGREMGKNFKTDLDWKRIFQKLGLKLKGEKQGWTILHLAKLKIYFLEK